MNEKEKKLAEKIGVAIEEIWTNYYTEEGIGVGDIEPHAAVQYERLIDNIAEIIYQVGEGNRTNKVFKVTIEEHISETFEVEAANIEEAMQLAEERYYKGEYVLGSEASVTARLMSADDGKGDFTEWTEF